MTTWRFRLLASTAVSLLALMATGSVAYADCQPDPANDGDTVTCTATDDDGFATSAANLNINVENGATVAGLSTGNSNSVVVDGSVALNNAQAQAAVQMTTSNLIVHPSGTVSITGDGVHGVQGFSADTIENQGQITAEGTNSFAVGISASDPSSIVNSGGITVSQSADGAFATAIAADALVTVRNAGTISVNADSGTARGIAILSADQAHPIENSGTISVSATNGQAIGVGFDNYGYFTNDGGINVTGNQATAISTGTNILGPSRVFNNGSITASASAGGLKSVGIEIVGTSGNTFSLENSGTISADIAVREGTGSIPPGGSNDTIDNTGTIAGDITLFMGNDVISNSNTIIGNVTFGSGDDTLTNSGTINGSVSGGPGNDTLNASTGILHGSVTGFETINGNLSLGAGDDRFDNPGTVDGNVDMGAGNDVFIARSSTVVNGNLTLGAGDDVILLSNDHPDFSFVTGTFDAGSGINTTGRVYESSADGTLDDDGSGKPYTMAIFGAGTTVTFQPQADFLAKSIVVYGDGTLDNSRGVTVSDGVAVDLADPGLTFINRGGLTAPIAIRSLKGGATVSSLTPIRGDVVLQGASNTFTSTASIEGNVTFGPGDDTFQTQGEVTGTIEGGAGNDTLIVDGDATFASDIYDFETFRTTSSAGHIEIQGGAAFRSMELAGPSPSASVVIPASGELLGAGDVTNVINEGTLIPGYIDETGFIPGILHVDGRYVQTGDNSTLFIVVDGARNSWLDVTGQASLNGQLLIYLNPSSEPVSPGARYTILHADGGVLNDFASGMVASTTFFDVYYTVDANDVTIEFDLSSFATPFLNSNEQAFARAMTRALQSRTAQGTAATFINTLAFSERSQAAAAIDQLIPQAALNMATPALVTHRAFLGSIAEKAREYGPDFGRQGHWWSWASGFGQFGDVSGGGTSYGFSTGGVVSGASYGVSENTALGFVVGASRSDISVDLQPGNNSHRSIDAGLYGAYIDGPVSATATASFGYDRFETDRRINTGPSIEQAAGRVGGYTMAARFEGAYALDAGVATVSPYVAAQVMEFHHGAYDETGAGTIGLHVTGEQITSVRSTLGFSAERAVAFGSGAEITFHAGAAWEREFGDRILSSRAAFLAAPTDTFSITGITQDRNTANVVGGVKAALTHGVDLSLRYEGNIGATAFVNRARADLTWRW